MSITYKHIEPEPVKVGLSPYTMEELYSRMDESEKQIESGETISGDDVHQQMLDYINA